MQGTNASENSVENFVAQMDGLASTLENRMKLTNLNEILPGPLDEMPEQDMRIELQRAFLQGQNMLLAEKWCNKYGKNIVFPMTITPRGAMPYRDWLGR